ncbi:MAG: dNTP triphosphohydrolase [Nannocystaceae bacterium]|nr:dNTP triphosphohydrolase [Nannocystaceae bacterium]
MTVDIAAEGAAPRDRKARRHADQGKNTSVGEDQREEFARDRDRVLYSSAFRRLAGVTQVVGAAEGHVFHNRLTHSMKAAQIGRRLAERFRSENELRGHKLDVDPEVVEAAALAHDLGHPPFGHAAEAELDRLLTANKSPTREEWLGKVDGFEGNAQTFRILTKLACHRAEYLGLDLTQATLCAVIKYPWYASQCSAGKREWNAYESESADFEFARPQGTDKGNEAQLMEYADDIAYSVHDVEDFYRAGWIPLHRLATEPRERRRFVDAEKDAWTGELTSTVASGVVSDILDDLLPEPLHVPYAGTVVQRAELRRFTSRLIGTYVRGVYVAGTGDGARVAMLPKHAHEIAVLKQLMVHYVFCNPALAAQQQGHRHVVRELFNAFYVAAHSSKKNAPAILPPGLRSLLETLVEEAGSEEERERIRTRIAADSVASLTEQEATALHRRLSGFDGRAVRDPIL